MNTLPAASEADPAFEDTVPMEPVATAPPVAGNFVAKHWRGAYGLAFSYWICGALLTLLLVALTKAMPLTRLIPDLGQRGTGASILLMYACLLTITVWQWVGIWRSASLHVQRGGQSGWAMAAKAMMLLAMARTGLDLYQTGYPLMTEGMQLLVSEDRTRPYAIRLLREGTEMELAGGMPFGTADAVRKTLDGAPGVKVLHLNSQGGRMQEAEQLSQLIRERQLTTYTATRCSSACAFAFLAGRQRLVGESGQLGFHSVSVGTLSGREITNLNAGYRSALKARGVPDSFIDHALSTSPSAIWLPTHAELLDNKVIDAVVDSKSYAMSGLSRWQDIHDIESGLLTVPPFAALAKYDAKNYARLRDMLIQGVQQGQTQNDVQAKMRAVFMGEVIPVYLRTAQDAPLVAYWRSQIAQMEALAQTSARQCTDFAFPQFARQPIDLKAVLPKPLLTQDLQMLAGLIESGATQPHVAQASTPQSQADFKAALMRMAAAVPQGLEVMRAPPKYKNDPQALCSATLGLYREILATPGEDRIAAILRDLH